MTSMQLLRQLRGEHMNSSCWCSSGSGESVDFDLVHSRVSKYLHISNLHLL